MSYAGKWERGAALVRKAIALSPHPPSWYYFSLAWYHYHKHDYEQALEMSLKIDLESFYGTHVQRATIYGKMGRTREAKAALEKVDALYPNYGADARAAIVKWLWDEVTIERQLDGLRKAGLDIPDEE